MKRLWLCLVAMLALASCINVEDFSVYWDKGVIDPTLAGTWKKVAPPGENPSNIPGPDVWRFTRDAGSYAVQFIEPIDPKATPDEIERLKADNEHRFSARTLAVGKSRFLMLRDPSGKGMAAAERYEVQRGTLRMYTPTEAGLEFLTTKHSTAKNIKANSDGARFVAIHTFDDEVFQILSEMADNSAYWFPILEYKQVR
jgi:hypothetical protein